ncbi:MAG: polyprenyl synthetase family protein [Verrucomicrobia bacterium]|nr:polyprenyl synthetase family protein [Verrucomicrobiota bacterium]
MLAADTKAAGVPLETAPSRRASFTWAQIVEQVDPFLRAVAERLNDQVDEFEPEIAAYVRYALSNQGKQLRPALVALSAEATGGVREELVTVAAIIEMVHLATLVHDDVMDEAAVRRRRPTLATQAGNAVAVLAGDCLFAHALRLAAGFPTPEICRAVASATRTVCTGEILQTKNQGRLDLTRAEYFRMLRMKTAELFALSCELGAWLSGCSPADRAQFHGFGIALGTAYQIYDDCVDLLGDEATAGKSVGTDLLGGKLTLPVIVTLERASLAERVLVQELIRGWEPRHLPRLRQFMERYDAVGESCEVIHGYCRKSCDCLQALTPNDGVQALLRAAGFLTDEADRLVLGP